MDQVTAELTDLARWAFGIVLLIGFVTLVGSAAIVGGATVVVAGIVLYEWVVEG